MYALWAYSAAQKIPKWWVWFYYLVLNSWSLNAMLTSQFGDVEKEIVVFGENQESISLLSDYFGYHRNMLTFVAVVLSMHPIVFCFFFCTFNWEVELSKEVEICNNLYINNSLWLNSCSYWVCTNHTVCVIAIISVIYLSCDWFRFRQIQFGLKFPLVLK
ncbi:hypothetical protein Pfo_005196 [Paulownia fortunei]|nr:hypothetical protein Pfo_005196 [Paulownia fortunei]